MPTKKKTASTKKAPVVRKKRVSKKKPVPRRKTATRKTAAATSSNNPSTPQTLILDPVVVINNARTLHQTLADIDGDADVTIDASAVEMIDTAVLQLLFAFVNKVQAGDHKISWKSPSEEFVSRADLLGLSRHLGIS